MNPPAQILEPANADEQRDIANIQACSKYVAYVVSEGLVS